MDIQKLIDKFMDGTSTLDKERLLGEYFRNEKDIPQELQPYRKMFAYFDKGMPVGEGMLVGEDTAASEGMSQNGNNNRPVRMAVLRRVLSVAAAVAVMFVVAYNIIGGGDDTAAVRNTERRFITQTVSRDTLPASAADSTANGDTRQESEPEQRQHKKYRYKPAPPEVMVADAAAARTDSIDGEARRLAEAELRKVEREQRYMQSLIQAVTLLNAADIAAVGDEVDAY